jgi:hypothetical protein
MQSKLMGLSPASTEKKRTQVKATTTTDYQYAEQQFKKLLVTEELDKKLDVVAPIVEALESSLSAAIVAAYQDGSEDDRSHCFLQRILYYINRLNLFWYDDLQNYNNERSLYVHKVRDQIEAAWQEWEYAQIDVAALKELDVKQALIERANRDLEPPLSNDNRYIREQMTEAGYRHLLAIASFDGLVEASRLSRILGGAANEVQCTLIRVLLEEYGNGRFSRKHSTFFATMLSEFGMNSEPEGYFELVPWEVLASANHNFLLTECKRYFLRYCGGLTYFEIAGPAAYRNYLTAAQRLELSQAAMGYWKLHIQEDERHGRWMLDDVALPLLQMYPDRAWELVLGYDQEKFMGERAAIAVLRSIRQAEQAT